MRSFQSHSATVLCLSLLAGGAAGFWGLLGRVSLSPPSLREERAHSAGDAWKKGRTLTSLGHTREAEQAFKEALQLYRRVGDSFGELIARAELARMERQRGDFLSALRLYQEAIALSKSPSADRLAPELRTSFLSSQREIYESTIDLLMELDGRQPGQGYDVRAFEVSEQNRAHSLLDALNRAADGRPVRPLKLREVQSLLEEETLLLTYSLGTDRSFLWAVTQDGFGSYELPGRNDVEAAARRVDSGLRSSRLREARAFSERAAEPLSRMLLGPVAASLDDKSLVIVAEGALQSVPFAVLPHPEERGSEPLLARHEITVIPSASILAALRERENRSPPSGLIAILGDPVFSERDERISREAMSEGDGTGGVRAMTGSDLSFRRLPGSRQEVKSILELASSAPTFSALGFNASRELVLSGRLSGYRVLHFASHGVLDRREPGRSGLVLSQFDHEGRPRDGVLRADEIRRLDLPADLVVLSACDTGLGSGLGEDGRATLLQSFLEAGASRVVASLWDVNDRATAELMTRFYRGLLVEDLRPVTALRQAQLSMMRETRWSAPYYWAGFVLQGDWR